MPIVDNRFADPDALAAALAQSVAADLAEGIAARGAALVVVSGGTTPVRFLEQLSLQALAWERVTVTLADERWVSPQNQDSNEHLIRQHLLHNAAAAANFVALYDANHANDPEAALPAIAARIAALVLPFDAVILGMGTDGHTASLFPGGDRLEQALEPDGTARVSTMRAAAAPVPRMTLTLSALLATQVLYLHIEGAEKRAVFDRAAREDSAAQDYPIRALLRHARVPVRVFWCA